MIFIFPNFHKKKFWKKIESIKFKKICYEYINNNSFINLDDRNHIKIVWSYSNAVKTHNVNIFHKKISATGLPVAEILIKYNNNNLEENDEVENEPINIELTDKKTNPYKDENSIGFKWSDLTEEVEEDIALANFIESLKIKQTDEKFFFFQKSNYMIAVSYIMKRKIKKFLFWSNF